MAQFTSEKDSMQWTKISLDFKYIRALKLNKYEGSTKQKCEYIVKYVPTSNLMYQIEITHVNL